MNNSSCLTIVLYLRTKFDRSHNRELKKFLLKVRKQTKKLSVQLLTLTLSDIVSQSRDVRDSRDPRWLLDPNLELLLSHWELLGPFSFVSFLETFPTISEARKSWYLGFWLIFAAGGSSSHEGLSGCLFAKADS